MALTKHIELNPSTNAYDCYIGDMLIGSRPTESAGRDLINEYIYDAERGRAPSPAPAPSAPAIRIARLWTDPARNDDLNDEGRGTLTYVGYVLGDDDSKAEVSFRVDGTEPPEVYMFGRDSVPLDEVERTIPHLLRLLADPRVQAAKAAAQQVA